MSANQHPDFPPHPNAISPGWLTERLHEAGLLLSGEVTTIDVDLSRNIGSAKPARLTITYDGNASSEAPRHLFVKIGKVHKEYADMCPGEAEFYTDLTSHQLPLPKCYAVVTNDRSGLHCLLLEDLGASHQQTPWPLPPSLPWCESAVRALARLHGHWWTVPAADSDISIATLRNNDNRVAANAQTLLPQFLRYMGDRVPEERARIMRKVSERIPDLKSKRLRAGKGITRIHGDAHFWNIMFPRDSARHDCLFIDWENWRYSNPATDLAYVIALHWYPDRRARYERRLLHAYFDTLTQDGSIAYSWNDLLADYRLGHLQAVVVPIFFQDAKLSPAIWWSHLERWFLAFEDLDCADLL